MLLAVMLFVSFELFANEQTLQEKHSLIKDGTSSSFRKVFFDYNIKESPISKIGLERTTCYGTCPAYLITITRDGLVTYEGFRYVKLKGKHTGKIPTYYLKNLFTYINNSSFFDMKDTYTDSITDNATSYTLVAKGEEEKIVKNYANSGPSELWSIEQHIDSLLNKSFTRTRKQRAPVLKAL